MKTKLAIILSFITIIFDINTSFAISGTCSYHQGVNCGASQSNGYVVCGDEWKDSSVLFRDVTECKPENKCSYLKPNYLAGLCSVDNIENSRKISLNTLNSQRAVLARTGSLGTGWDTLSTQEQEINKKYDNEVSVCKNLLDSYKQQQDSYTQCLTTESSNYNPYILVKTEQATTTLSEMDKYKLAASELVNDYLKEYPDRISIIKKDEVIYIISSDFEKYKDMDSDQIMESIYGLKKITSTSTPKLSKTLKFGSKDPEVSILQSMLRVEQSGYFGSKTRKAVIELQKLNRLPQTGIVGEMTRKLLNK